MVDYATAQLFVTLSDGTILHAPSESRQPDTSQDVVRGTYDVARSMLELRLRWGAEVSLEVSGRPPDGIGGRPVVYLDQNHWITLAQREWAPERAKPADRDAADQLARLAAAHEIILPLSSGHLVETGRAGKRWRRQLATTMLRLSHGWQMASPVRIRAGELRSALAGTDLPTKRAVFTLEPDVIFAPGHAAQVNSSSALPAEVRDLKNRLTWATSLAAVLVEDEVNDDAVGREKATQWAATLQALAAYMRQAGTPREHKRLNARACLLADLQNEIATAAAAVGADQPSFEAWLSNDLETAFAAMPYIGRLLEVLVHRLSNADDRWETNDLNDMHYLAPAAGYADVVVAEKKTAEYLRRAARRTPAGAHVCRTLSEVVEHLR